MASQNERILAVLWDGKPHTVPEIHRRAGTCRLNSRVSELRKRGYGIECLHRSGRRGAGAYSYVLRSTPPGAEPPAVQQEWARAMADAQDRRDATPRDQTRRYRIYAVRDGGVLDLVGAVPAPDDLGHALIALGAAGALRGACVGILDTHGTDSKAGTWVLNAWEGR
jgi:hypothetical protein